MRNILALIGLVVVVFASVGWYRGWYSFRLTAGSNGVQDVHLGVDTNKIEADGAAAAHRVGEVAEGLKSKASDAGHSTGQPAATLPTPPGFERK